MRLALALIVALHGLIHFTGPAKAFGWADVSALRLPISPVAGAGWLICGVLFLAAAGLILKPPPFPAPDYWFVPALPAIFLSQVLIAQAWTDARFGTIANLIIVVPAIVAALSAWPSGYRATYNREARVYLSLARGPDGRSITDADIASLPAGVRRYLRFADIVGKPRVRNFHVSFTGAIRQGPTSPWMSSVIDQHSTFSPNSRLFIMASRLYGLPFEALHLFKGPTASFEVKVASLFRMVEARGPEMDQAETVTMLNDMCMLAPATLVDADIDWSEETDRRVRATLRYEGRSISAWLTFGEDGALINFESDDRFRTDGKVHERARWSTPVAEYSVVDGIKVPRVAEARWSTSDYDYAYARFEIRTISYNVTAR